MFQSHFKSDSMRAKIFIPISLLAVLLWSCGKDLLAPITPENSAIVESYLHAGDSVITVKITRLLPFSEDTADATEYISGLKLTVNGIELTETDTGIYTLDLGENRIQPGDTYLLSFEHYGATITSTATIPALPVNLAISANNVYMDRITSSGGMPSGGPMDDLDLTWDNDDAGNYYVLIEYLESTPDYINYAMASSDVSTIQGISPMTTSGTRLGNRNLYFFGSYRIVVFRVTDDFADLYEQSTSNSNNIVTPVTTINNGFGVFTGMASDTVFLEVIEN